MRYINQCYSKDCGFTCLKILLSNTYKNESYLYLKNAKPTHAYSYLELIELAKYYGLTLIGFETDEKEKLFQFDNFPFIASLSYEKDGALHAVIVKKATKRNVYYFDPAYGELKLSLKKFNSLWNNTGLYIEGYDEVRTNIPSKPSFNLFKKSSIFLLTFLQLLSSLAIIFGTLFMDKSVPFFIPIILFSLFIIFEILFRAMSIKAMKNIDIELYEKSDSLNAKFKSYYHAVEEMKERAVLLPINLAFKFITALFLILISMFNHVYNIIPISLSVILALSDIFIFKSKYHALNLSIATLENEMFNAKTLDKRNVSLRNIHKETYRYAYAYQIFKYVSFFLLVLSIILSMTLQDIYSLEYVVFNSFLFGYLLSILKGLFSFNIDIENYKKAKALINDLL